MIPITDPLMYDMQIHSKVINISILISLKSSTRWKNLSESNNNTIIFFLLFLLFIWLATIRCCCCYVFSIGVSSKLCLPAPRDSPNLIRWWCVHNEKRSRFVMRKNLNLLSRGFKCLSWIVFSVFLSYTLKSHCCFHSLLSWMRSGGSAKSI